MAWLSTLPLLGKKEWLPQHGSAFSDSLSYVLLTVFVTAAAYSWTTLNSSMRKLPIINPPKFFSASEARELHLTSSKDLLAKARNLWPKKPFRMLTDWGDTIILPGEFANEIRNDPKLSFAGATRQDGFGTLSGFEPYADFGRPDNLFQIVAKKHLTKLLAKVTEPLSDEAALAVSLNLGDSREWRDVLVGPVILDIISRMSSRVFLGHELCRNEAWLKITKEYTINMFTAIRKFQHYPPQLRKVLQWFIPECKLVRDQFHTATQIITPIIAKRRKIKEEARAAGEEIPVFNDALDWVAQEATAKGSEYDMTTFQLMISFVAIHTSTNLLAQTMLDIAEHPEIMQPLRNEIVGILRADGWKKTSLYNMRLLDSVLKESQRLRPIGYALMRRSVEEDFKLSDGTALKKGMRLHVDTYRMSSPEVYENPEVWDPYRFSKLRSQPGYENTAQLVSTTQDHLGFGHGEHGCPGRFFAANEIKIALCHLLIKYEWKLAPGTDVSPVVKGFAIQRNPTARILIRRRETMELDIDDLVTSS
ncbi:hypothetical protein PVAG01_08911 [Phlyctema vagabunda]|uniref:Cytochrome P450 n=1 Tax=Phlyctema vagabunda TaxID=108571 RepID=A0ABR4PB79_9HELO